MKPPYSNVGLRFIAFWLPVLAVVLACIWTIGVLQNDDTRETGVGAKPSWPELFGIPVIGLALGAVPLVVVGIRRMFDKRTPPPPTPRFRTGHESSVTKNSH